jgi:hypothetical protein
VSLASQDSMRGRELCPYSVTFIMSEVLWKYSWKVGECVRLTAGLCSCGVVERVSEYLAFDELFFYLRARSNIHIWRLNDRMLPL